MAYTTLERLKASLGKDSVKADHVLEDLLATAEMVVNTHCGRRFDVLAATLPDPSARYFVPPSSGNRLLVDDIANGTGLTIVDNGTTLSASDYQLEPLNQLGPDMSYRPINAIRRDGWWNAPDYPGHASIVITTARWGWSTFDSRVARATEMAAKDLWDMRETRFGRAGFGEFAAVIVRQNQALADLLKPLCSHSPGWLPSVA